MFSPSWGALRRGNMAVLPPVPLPTTDLRAWALKTANYLQMLEAIGKQPSPKVVQLERKQATAKATMDGLLMFDPSGAPVYSRNGAWKFLLGSDAASGDFVKKSGDTMTGSLTAMGIHSNASVNSINGNSPQLQFNESDRTDPDGRFRFIASSNVLYCQKAASAEWATAQSIWTYTTRMNVDVPFRTTASCIIEGLVNSAGTAGLQITGSYPSIWFRDPGQNPNPDLYFTAGNGNMRVGPGDAAGNISATPWSIINSTSGWSTSSDPRLKKNIRDIHYGLDTILALRPVAFDWIEDGRHDIGFLAPEVREHVPEVVEPMPHDVAGNDDPLLGMRKDALVAVLVKAVQELTLRVQELEAA